MLHSIKNYLFKNLWIMRYLYYLIYLRNKAITARSLIEERKSYSIFEFEKLSQNLDCPYICLIEENNLYGNGKVMFPHFKHLRKDYTGIEHGFVFGSLVQNFHIGAYTKSTITFSDYRKNFIREKSNNTVICVGPYIHYADIKRIINDESYLLLRKELGKTLLVFPVHGLSNIDPLYDVNHFIEYLKAKAQNYTSVLVCMYWADIIKGNHKAYEDCGFKIVTAGHSYDYYFLDRLRLIFELSDAVISNSVGTHLGYAVYLNKPMYLFHQPIKISSSIKDNPELKQRSQNDLESYQEITDTLYNLFSDDSLVDIKTIQFEYVSELFGFKYTSKKAN